MILSYTKTKKLQKNLLVLSFEIRPIKPENIK